MLIFERQGNDVIVGKEYTVYENGSLVLGKMCDNQTGTYIPEVYEDGKKKGNLKPIQICAMGMLCSLIFTFI